jgi:predicted nuclease with TOPRIM domain
MWTREQLIERMTSLRSEYEKGEQKIHGLQHELQQTEQTLLRISGAITVLEELIASSDQADSNRNREHPKISAVE